MVANHNKPPIRQLLLLTLYALLPASSFASNEERFSWLGIEFCKTTLAGLVQKHPNGEHIPKYELFVAPETGKTLGTDYYELVFSVRPDGIVTGLRILTASSSILPIEREMDALAHARWGDDPRKLTSEDYPEMEDAIGWLPRRGDEIRMGVYVDDETTLYSFRRLEGYDKLIIIIFSSGTDCDRRNMRR